MNQCSLKIDGILQRLTREFASPQAFFGEEAECVNALFLLEQPCSQVLADRARTQLTHSGGDENAEFLLQVLLHAIAAREQQEALELILEALFSDKTDDKEAYVQMAMLFQTLPVEELIFKRLDALPDNEHTSDRRAAILAAVQETIHRVDDGDF